MEPNQLSLLAPVLQFGAFGLCLVLIALLWWLFRQLVEVLRGNTKAMQSLCGLVEEGNETTSDLRDRLLQWQCPFRNEPRGDPAETGRSAR
jgi:hypothetical protein